MYIHAKKDNWMAALYEVVDLDTNKIIPKVLWADDKTGEYAQYNFSNDGNILLTNGEPDLVIKKGNIHLRIKNYTSY